MKINATLTADEGLNIIKQYLEERDDKKIKTIYAEIESYNEPDDWRGELPLGHRISGYEIEYEN